MFFLLSIAILAGFFTQYLDFRIDFLRKRDFLSWILVFLSSIFIAYITYIFPDVMMGIILGVAVAGKTSNNLQIFNFIIPFLAFSIAVISGMPLNLLLMGFTFMLSVLDELDFPLFKGVRPMLPLGMILLVAISMDTYITLATITILSFDLGYLIASKINNSLES